MNESRVRSRSAITRSAFDGMQRIGEADVRDAGVGEHLRLAELRAADADRAALELQARDFGRLVRLGVRPQPMPPAVAAACIRSMLRSTRGQSTSTQGVRSSCRVTRAV